MHHPLSSQAGGFASLNTSPSSLSTSASPDAWQMLTMTVNVVGITLMGVLTWLAFRQTPSSQHSGQF